MSIAERVSKLMADVKGVCVLASVDEQGTPQLRWMGELWRDTEQLWVLYLMSHAGARKMQQIAQNPRVQLLFSRPDWSEVAQVSGTARAEDSPQVKRMLWAAIPELKNHFPSREDPVFGVIKITADCVELLALAEQHHPYCETL